jgi:hypothetical protein
LISILAHKSIKFASLQSYKAKKCLLGGVKGAARAKKGAIKRTHMEKMIKRSVASQKTRGKVVLMRRL